jgi:hypothetical protein
MKPYYIVSFWLLLCLDVTAQNSDSTVHKPIDSFEYYVPRAVKTKIYLFDNRVITGKITKITNEMIVVALSLQDSTKSLPQQIPISQIKMIRVKRDAIGLGMAGGAVLGSLAGYGAGYVSYSHDNSFTESENNDRQKTRGFIGAAITVVPGTIIGGIVGGLTTRRRFIVNGSSKNILKLVHVF